MSRSVVTKTWLGGLGAIVVGVLIVGVGVGSMLAFGGTLQPAPSGSGFDWTPARDSAFWTSVGAIVVGGTVILVGSLVQLVAWIGAVMNTYSLTDKTWFVVLLVGGVVGLAFGLVGMAVMVAYLIAGPDVAPAGSAVPPAASSGARLAPAS